MKTFIQRILIPVFLLLNTNTIVFSQDAYFSQYYNTPIYNNPANIGLYKGLKVRLAYRNQWPRYNNDLKTYNFSMDLAEREMPGAGGFGIIFNTNKQGEGFIKRTMAGALYSVRVKLSRHWLSQFGVMGAFVQKQIDSDEYIWSDQLDNRHGLLYSNSSFPGFKDKNVSYPDISLGGLLHYETHFISGTFGLAVHHVLKPNESFFDLEMRVPRKYVFHTDFIILQQSNPKKGFKFNPGLLLENQAGFNTFTLGMNVAKSVLYTGIWYRNKQSIIYDYQSVIIMAGINVPLVNDYSRLKFTYSYDISITQMKGNGGAHEVTLRFEFDLIHLIKSRSSFAHDYPVIYNPVIF